MAYQNITIEKNDGITRMMINRPPVNIMDGATLQEMNEALEELAKDDETKVLLIRGSGEKAFCAGVEVKDHLLDKVPGMMTTFAKLFRNLRALGKPTIAVVNGVALGGGCEVIAGCDMAIAAAGVKMGQPEVQLGGLAPAAAALFPRIMGEKKAFEMIVLGENITAEEAARIGLVNKVVPLAELDSTAEEYARKLMKMSPLAVKLVREAVYKCADSADLDSALDTATELGIGTWQTKDGQEGLASFLEKRSPVWKNE